MTTSETTTAISRVKYAAQGVVTVSTVTVADKVFASCMPWRAARRDGDVPSTGSKRLVNIGLSLPLRRYVPESVPWSAHALIHIKLCWGCLAGRSCDRKPGC